ncbi:MAG: type II toxin-antitoxin system VapC family toxin [Verrucomicrobia bacterium]|nr:type II toxin-antitoxin system VapC family toxin [Verrucomicrobiota bacterium]
MPELPLIAADTNVLLDYARADETVVDCFDTLSRRLPGAVVIVLPTVIHELADLADDGETEDIRRASRLALRNILHPWGFQPVNYVPVGHGIVEQIASAIRQKGLMPGTEVNDSYVIAEAALIGASILLSADAHLKDLPYAALKLVLDAADVRAPLIASPWKIVHQFFR